MYGGFQPHSQAVVFYIKVKRGGGGGGGGGGVKIRPGSDWQCFSAHMLGHYQETW